LILSDSINCIWKHFGIPCFRGHQILSKRSTGRSSQHFKSQFWHGHNGHAIVSKVYAGQFPSAFYLHFCSVTLLLAKISHRTFNLPFIAGCPSCCFHRSTFRPFPITFKLPWIIESLSKIDHVHRPTFWSRSLNSVSGSNISTMGHIPRHFQNEQIGIILPRFSCFEELSTAMCFRFQSEASLRYIKLWHEHGRWIECNISWHRKVIGVWWC
jgi:hypothetical protein